MEFSTLTVNFRLPVGFVFGPVASVEPPPGWFKTDGQKLFRADYPEIAALYPTPASCFDDPMVIQLPCIPGGWIKVFEHRPCSQCGISPGQPAGEFQAHCGQCGKGT